TSGQITASGTLTISDVDTNQSSFQAQSNVAGTYGTFNVSTNGAWTYTANNSQSAIQNLGSTGTLTENFNVKSADGTNQVVTVTIKGTNDAPIAVADVAVLSGSTVSGNILTNDSDIDVGDVLSVSTI